jgi:hypothetical protein
MHDASDAPVKLKMSEGISAHAARIAVSLAAPAGPTSDCREQLANPHLTHAD